jgi:hypothetical protein
MNIRNPSALFLAILCALSTCLLPSCRDESLDPTRANNINRLKEMGNRLWLYHENKNRFPEVEWLLDKSEATQCPVTSQLRAKRETNLTLETENLKLPPKCTSPSRH